MKYHSKEERERILKEAMEQADKDAMEQFKRRIEKKTEEFFTQGTHFIGTEWRLVEREDECMLLLRTGRGYIAIGLNDNGLPGDKTRVEIKGYIEMSYAALNMEEQKEL